MVIEKRIEQIEVRLDELEQLMESLAQSVVSYIGTIDETLVEKSRIFAERVEQEIDQVKQQVLAELKQTDALGEVEQKVSN